MDIELIMLNSSYILIQFWWNLVSKEWYQTIKHCQFIYQLKYHKHEHIDYLKETYINIQIHCRPLRNITDVSMLGNLHTLDMSYCENITDVSMLGNLHTLIMSYCENITDVSMLGNLHTLDISGCQQITDISMLGRLHELNISFSKNITDVSMLDRYFH